MDPARWPLVREIVADAMELHGEARAQWVRTRCAADVELRAECESLLAQEHEVESRVGDRARAIDAVAADRSSSADANLIGQSAGVWRVVSELGRGGMGAVFLAERRGDGFTQRGALKGLATLAGAEARERFRIEQRALARLEHPGIARLIDAGELEDGRPFLVMEVVDGAPIDRWCSERGLDVRARVALFVQVCDAVHAAHQNLVVHRDLKPANVLVDAHGRVRIVDFGIARVLSEHAATDATAELPRAFTPRYASPEQMRGDRASTSTDIYSLGVILYELLVGVSPYHGATRSTRDLERAVREADPIRPSEAAAEHATHARRAAALRGDLDAIVMRAIAKAPERRYESAAAFALDLRRHSSGEAIDARPDTLGYRLSTLVRRHKLASGFAAALGVALVAGSALSTAGYLEARAAGRREAQQRELAEERYRDLREVARSLVFDAHDAIRLLPGATAARETLLESAQSLLERLERQGADDAELLVDLARSYTRLGEVRGRASEAHSGQVGLAERNYRRAIELAASAPSAGEEARYAAAQARAKLGELLTLEGRADEARTELEAALAERVELLALRPSEWAADPDLGYLNERLFELELSQGSLASAERRLEDTERFLAAALVEQRDVVLWRENQALGFSHRAKLAELRREGDAAIEWRAKAVEAFELVCDEAPERVRTRQRLAQSLGDLGVALGRAGRAPEARERLADALAEQRELLEVDPASAAYRSDVAMTTIYLAELATAAGDHEQALALFGEALELRRALASEDPSSARARRSHAIAADQVGGALRRLGRFDEAYAVHIEAQRVFEELAEQPGASAEARRSLAVSCYALGQLQRSRAEAELDLARRQALWSSAREHYARSLEVIEELAASGRLAPRDEGVAPLLRAGLEACDAAL